MIGGVPAAAADPSHSLSTTARRVVRALRSPTASGRTVAGRLARMPSAERRVRELANENLHLRELYEAWVPTGHFYSPFPDLDDYGRRVAGLRDPHRELPGIDLHEDEQLALLEVLAALLDPASGGGGGDLHEHEDRRGDRRYWLDNPAYAHGDGTVLHAMLRHARPRRIVEVGSGYSSALILDTVEQHLPATTVTFVEPYPALVEGLLRADDERRVTIHRVPVQDVDPAVFAALEPGDLLFIDSTHVVKAGSDVNHLFFEVLPRLAVGVWVHLHDIFFPFEYPEAWVREGRAWHEAYLLRAFLYRNEAFAIRWFQDMLWARHREALARLPWVARNPGANLWLQRVA
jgi:predicted O-methyltransferase YrrM